MYDEESHFEVPEGRVLAVGDTFDVIRGNGPREGERLYHWRLNSDTTTILKLRSCSAADRSSASRNETGTNSETWEVMRSTARAYRWIRRGGSRSRVRRP